MTEQWPPPGHTFTYKTEIELANGYKTSFDVTLPSAAPNVNLATFRLGRHGGESNADRLFQQRLYTRIGAITVASGHVETAMKRLLLLLRGQSQFSDVADKTWSQLHRCLQSERTDADARRKRLRHVLQWGEKNHIHESRNDVIHSYWWIYDGCGVMRSRFYQNHDQDGVSMVSSLAELDEYAQVLFEYARRLDDLLGEDWPRAMLPGHPQTLSAAPDLPECAWHQAEPPRLATDQPTHCRTCHRLASCPKAGRCAQRGWSSHLPGRPERSRRLMAHRSRPACGSVARLIGPSGSTGRKGIRSRSRSGLVARCCRRWSTMARR